MKIIVYDLECKNSPVTKADWTNWAWLGISVGCAYDFSTGEYSVYLDDNLQALVDLLNDADMIAAFNHVSFDNNLLRGVGAAMKLERQLDRDDGLFNYDMLVESRAGAKVDNYTKGFKLDAHLKATLGPSAMKTGDGAGAPALYKAGKMGELISYCLADVHRERRLFEYIWHHGAVACEHGSHAVRQPQEILCVGGDVKIEDLKDFVPPAYVAAGVDQGASGGNRSVETRVPGLREKIYDANALPHVPPVSIGPLTEAERNEIPCGHCGVVHAHGTTHPHLPTMKCMTGECPICRKTSPRPVTTTNPEDL